jgi:hypothetical protein
MDIEAGGKDKKDKKERKEYVAMNVPVDEFR